MSHIKQTGQVMMPSSLLLPLRVFMGLTFLYAGIQHLTDQSYFNPSKQGFIGNLVAQYAVGSPIHDFLIGAVQPNAVIFGYLVAVGEISIGTAVSIGLLFRMAAFAGMLLNFTFFLSATWNAFPFYFGSDIVFVMCWLTLLLTGPQPGLSLDGTLAEKFNSLQWLVSSKQLVDQTNGTEQASKPEQARVDSVPIPTGAKLYPKQISEINRAFERIKEQFVSHQETQTILEFSRAFIISLGVERKDALKILQGIENLVKRNTFEKPA